MNKTALPLDIVEIYNKELPPLDYVFLGYKTKTIAFINSAGGVGKSMLALHLAFSLADIDKKYNFEPFITKETQRGKVIYLSLEDPQDVLEHRIQTIAKHINSKTDYNILESINQNLFIYPLYGKDFALYKQKTLQKDTYRTLLELGQDSRLIIIDTFRRLHDSDENDNGLMSELLKRLESICNDTDTSILLLHHQNKSAINEKNNSQTAMRGADALVSNSRLVINLSTLKEKECQEYGIQQKRRKDYVKVIYSKVNYAKIPDEFILARGNKGVLELCNCNKNIANAKKGKKNNLLKGLKND